MLRPDGYVKVLDFGIAKLAESVFAQATRARSEGGAEPMTLVETNLGSILGTVRYMSPEQACPDARGIDRRTDVWSLGVVLYEMVTGHAPFTGDTPRDVMSAILEKEPPPLTRYVAHPPAELQADYQQNAAQRSQGTVSQRTRVARGAQRASSQIGIRG